MKGIVSGLNKNVPQRIDEVTTLSKAYCENGSLRYAYELNDAEGVEFSKFDDMQTSIFKDVQYNISQEIYCTALIDMQEHTNSIIWTYNLGDKKFAEFEFKKSDCKK